MIETTLDMLRARQHERVVCAGVLASILADQLDDAVRRLEAARDAAHECAAKTDGRKDRARQQLYRDVAAFADDMIGPVRQLAERAT